MFQFKQFAVDQSGCAMKINTDGVLLGALANNEEPRSILDIGTGTGVVAMMLAQRFALAQIDAVEIDHSAAHTAIQNFNNSDFASRLSCYEQSFEQFFKEHPEKKYDLIVSNPPFYTQSLKSPNQQINVAKHADENFFADLLKYTSGHLTEKGLFWIIAPVNTSDIVQRCADKYGLYQRLIISIKSYPHSEPHRYLIAFGSKPVEVVKSEFTIYQEQGKYTAQYAQTLKNFFTIF
ncbi:tRNA1(Val) (adenine(37)-N6)-methyltransferase [Mucilaginibacter sp. KACC 22063]|uniref:tRNA1(Val) (adenine(37)-N6)-methyltransferase n=1 Tax=Mucilaginibacter sp. KACC 22063 TaxID=3025666 RepID=UPI002367142D|nr:methyltransferase [Mucilaginibacter sp. KACC 22063]WDF53838.1 methyltransferase [Mucilaginibacter sp. KACC 22063]